MATTQAPARPVEISDPNNVAETVVTGPFNVVRMGAMVMFTFTVMRPDVTAVFSGNKNPSSEGVVAARILMPTQMAEELMRVIAQTLTGGTGPGSAPGRSTDVAASAAMGH